MKVPKTSYSQVCIIAVVLYPLTARSTYRHSISLLGDASLVFSYLGCDQLLQQRKKKWSNVAHSLLAQDEHCLGEGCALSIAALSNAYYISQCCSTSGTIKHPGIALKFSSSVDSTNRPLFRQGKHDVLCGTLGDRLFR